MRVNHNAILLIELKGTVHPKMEIPSSFCLVILNLFQTCMSFFLLLNTKDILKNVGNQTVEGSHLLSIVWLPKFFKISYFVFNRRKKLIQVCNKLRMTKQNDDRIFIFG